jgi:hypothetical protein
MKPRAVPGTINLISLVALVVTPFAHSSFAFNPNPIPPVAHRERPAPASLRPVLGDFDGDSRIDLAEIHLSGTHRCIRVRYGDSRENHLELPGTIQTQGTLLARDINGDNRTDLIWIFSVRSEPAMVWLGDGPGHFSKADGRDIESLRAELLANSDLAETEDSTERQIGLTTDPISCEPADSAGLDREILDIACNAYGNQPSVAERYLSYLQERGPPFRPSF